MSPEYIQQVSDRYPPVEEEPATRRAMLMRQLKKESVSIF